MFLKNKYILRFKQMRDIQSVQITDDYSAGMYNGIESCLALLEGREPELFLRKDEENLFKDESEEQKKRTIVTGRRVVKK